MRPIVAWLSVFMLLSAPPLLAAADGQSPADAAPANMVFDPLKPLIEAVSSNPWVQGSLLILITFAFASLLSWLLFRLLRALTSKTSHQLDDHFVLLLQPPVTYTLIALGITAGIEVMPLPDVWNVMLSRIIRSINVIIWIIFLGRFATLLLNRIADYSGRISFIQRRTVTLFDNIAKVVIFGAGIYLIFVIWHIDMTAWLASAGIVGIAVGFAAKDTLSNLFSGVFIVADAPYKVGDYIVLDNASRGMVTNIGLRSTRILTRDDIEVTIPNSIIGNSMIINQSGGLSEKMRIRLKIGVAYGSDIDQVKQILLDVADSEPLVCRQPTPRVRFRAFGGSSLDLELLFWANHPEERGRILDAMNTAVYKRFNETGIEIPYAKQDLYIKAVPDRFSLPETAPPDTATGNRPD
ncbi:mechanosensitive ion channel family protein [Desulfofustis glycolicus]|uniref:Mechanosensitive ion channel n=1 Tax=Desulfofustis glycolicus DSM 9705 TaxID=1121409 RepID=A0A1M5SX76_9BACT|nr:mechanosensitive ion channel family protein [Desulfofustis glycolicus]MCB2215248.1 mechanosensitive ion channel family protein [Desulfobulbaceae bacterium]SHH43164.1 Mechanosensitive ion channel [Desulfofustis glycolicus DSM 9705]